MAATHSLDELTAPLTVEELKTSFYTALATVGVTTTTWKPGAVTRTIIAVVCVVLHALSVLISNVAKGGFLTLAQGAWKRLVARHVFNVEYQAATFAAGTALLSNSSGATYDFDPDDLEIYSSITGKSYRNTAFVSVGPLASNVPCPVRAVEAGSASSALIGEIDSVVGGHNGLTVSNPAVLVGLDDESDPALEARSLEKLGALSPNGPADAYSHVAKSAARADGTRIGVTAARPVPDGLGGVDVYVRTATGALSAPDLADVDEALQVSCAPLAVTVRTHNATPVTVPISYQAWAYRGATGLTESDFKVSVAAAITQYFADAPLGGFNITGAAGKIYHDDLRAEINHAKRDGASLRIFRVNLTTPATDIELGAHEFAVPGVITGQVSQVSPPRGTI